MGVYFYSYSFCCLFPVLSSVITVFSEMISFFLLRDLSVLDRADGAILDAGHAMCAVVPGPYGFFIFHPDDI